MSLLFSWDGSSENTHSSDAIAGTATTSGEAGRASCFASQLTVLVERNEGVGTRHCQYSTTFVGKFEQHREPVLQMQFG